MEAIGSIAAVAQIAGQLIDLTQQILLARQRVRRAPKAIKDLDSQLWRLNSTAKQVIDEPELQIKPIHEELEEIYTIAMELQRIIKTMESAQRHGRSIQILRALVVGQRDDAALKDVLDRLRDAQNVLGIRINVAHVRTTTGVAKGVQKIELGLESFIQKDTNTSTEQQRFVIDKNTADAAQQHSSIAVLEESTSSTAKISENQALNGSQQSNVISIGPKPRRRSKKSAQ